ncbi:TetR/AcrR family transcriptional regulator [Nocardioides sp. SYSU D00038]|uniref:TetR/AcrR family transcriptional regulator n=1 Tax=Nocardioides sp. SYSU D00038 TaxID=2812554 RepID=UPI001966DE58|nr:TetR/AcrR family transcriptional regulator [Nocardioides sp. SYSU D00038]
MPTPTRRTSEARDRLLRIASGIFYAKGIHSVGIEEIVATAEVTRSTLYRHFPSKEDLVVAYLDSASLAERQQVAALIADDQSPEDAVRSVAAAVAAQIRNPVFRGCAFLNAAAEYPDADHPVRRAVRDHRQWFLDTVTTLVERLPDRPPAHAAELFVLLRDGAMAAGCLADPDEVARTFLDGVEGLLAARA